ncbi:neuropeptide CCHamide-1 receptor-like [Amphiura filiformis]|uniref:neuropeptide CCHamide-1 receptor-like n=1 Tax=Amphiura filiformis TaxID=82378 RepID=UPI003B226ECB
MDEEGDFYNFNSEDLLDYFNITEVDCSAKHLYLEARDIVGPVFLSILTAFGIIGNFALFCVILYTPQMRTAANILIINLTVGDLFYIICTAPFYIETELFPCMNQPIWACKIQSFFPVVGQGGCVYSLAALSRERYGAIVHGIQARQRSGKLRNAFTVCLVWIISFITGIPVLIAATKQSEQQCSSLPQFSTLAKIYETYRFFFLYLIPLIVIAIYYALMAQTLFKSITGFGDNRTGNHQTEARKRLAIIILIVTVFFGVFWFPYYVYILWFQFAFESQNAYGNDLTVTFFRNFHYIMALINSSLNPWCVFVMSSGHRRRLIQCLCCGKFGRNETSKAPTSSQCGTRRRGSGGVSFTQVTTTPL